MQQHMFILLTCTCFTIITGTLRNSDHPNQRQCEPMAAKAEGEGDVHMSVPEKAEPSASYPKEDVQADNSKGATTVSAAALLNHLLEKLPQSIGPENFKETLLQLTDALLDHHGGPVQYLQSQLGSEPNVDWLAFAADLEAAFPRRADLTYLDGLKFPAGSTSPGAIKMSLWQLGWHSDCSSKPPAPGS